MLNLLGKAQKERGRVLEQQLAARALAPVFFTRFGVPDTMDGRFDMMALHAWLALARLQESGQDKDAQALTDAVFIGFDEALREQGISDMGMGRRMKAMANAFYGRLSAYGTAKTQSEMAQALARNVWRGAAVDDRARALALYVESAKAALAAAPAGALDFGSEPASRSEAAGPKKR
jgi:cytochrome b pre-mRNA-processing protein 3